MSLELATMDELAAEMKRRVAAIVIAYTNPGKVAGDPGEFNTMLHGNSTTCSGLTRALQLRVDRELAPDTDDA